MRTRQYTMIADAQSIRRGDGILAALVGRVAVTIRRPLDEAFVFVLCMLAAEPRLPFPARDIYTLLADTARAQYPLLPIAVRVLTAQLSIRERPDAWTAECECACAMLTACCAFPASPQLNMHQHSSVIEFLDYAHAVDPPRYALVTALHALYAALPPAVFVHPELAGTMFSIALATACATESSLSPVARNILLAHAEKAHTALVQTTNTATMPVERWCRFAERYAQSAIVQPSVVAPWSAARDGGHRQRVRMLCFPFALIYTLPSTHPLYERVSSAIALLRALMCAIQVCDCEDCVALCRIRA